MSLVFRGLPEPSILSFLVVDAGNSALISEISSILGLKALPFLNTNGRAVVVKNLPTEGGHKFDTVTLLAAAIWLLDRDRHCKIHLDSWNQVGLQLSEGVQEVSFPIPLKTVAEGNESSLTLGEATRIYLQQAGFEVGESVDVANLKKYFLTRTATFESLAG
jgi:hypothetical protein